MHVTTFLTKMTITKVVKMTFCGGPSAILHSVLFRCFPFLPFFVGWTVRSTANFIFVGGCEDAGPIYNEKLK